jgi:hypothetical protein
MNIGYGQPTGNDFSAVRTAKWQDTNRFKYIRINNQERSSGTPTNFQVNLGNDSLLDRCEQIQLMSCIIPNVGFNVSAKIGNNNFTIQFAGSPSVTIINIPDGFYTTADILTILNTIPAPSGTIVFTQDPITGSIIATSSAIAITIRGSASFPNTSELNSYLGFTATQGPSLVITSQSRPALNGDTIFFIHSAELGMNITYLDTKTTGGLLNDVNGMFSIPVTVPYNQIQSYIGQAEDRIVFGRRTRSIRNFNITLRTNNGRELVLGKNDQVVIVLKAIFSVDQR